MSPLSVGDEMVEDRGEVGGRGHLNVGSRLESLRVVRKHAGVVEELLSIDGRARRRPLRFVTKNSSVLTMNRSRAARPVGPIEILLPDGIGWRGDSRQPTVLDFSSLPGRICEKYAYFSWHFPCTMAPWCCTNLRSPSCLWRSPHAVSAQTGSISGLIVDARDGTPLEKVSVRGFRTRDCKPR